MFNGIVESIGTVQHSVLENDCLKINVKPQKKFSDLQIGDSLSINGVCLTLTDLNEEILYATIVPETLRLSNLGKLSVGSVVNLERSLKMGDRISGHFVQGHVDATGEITALDKDGEAALLLNISIASNLEKYIVKKGYIAVDGMSLTIVDITKHYFTVTLIPHTTQNTIASYYRIGTKVNLEVDMFGKYIEKLIQR